MKFQSENIEILTSILKNTKTCSRGLVVISTREWEGCSHSFIHVYNCQLCLLFFFSFFGSVCVCVTEIKVLRRKKHKLHVVMSSVICHLSLFDLFCFICQRGLLWPNRLSWTLIFLFINKFSIYLSKQINKLNWISMCK